MRKNHNYISLFVLLAVLATTPSFAQYIELEGGGKKPPPEENVPDGKNKNDERIFQSIQANVDKDGGSVHVFWEYKDWFKKDENLDKYLVKLYRFQDQPTSWEDAEKGKLLKMLDVSKNYFQDQPEPRKAYYYAIFAFKDGDIYSKYIQEGVNLAALINYDPLIEKIFKSIVASPKDEKIVISWEYAEEFRAIEGFQDHKIELYRFQRDLKSIQQLHEEDLIAKLFAERNYFDDTLPEEVGTYHYAIFVKRNGVLYPKNLQLGINWISPVFFRSRSAAISLENLEKILKNHYYRKDYRNTVRKLEPYKKSTDENIRRLALFYTGLALFKEAKFKESMAYFVHPSVVQFDKERAQFWFRRVMERIKKR